MCKQMLNPCWIVPALLVLAGCYRLAQPVTDGESGNDAPAAARNPLSIPVADTTLAGDVLPFAGFNGGGNSPNVEVQDGRLVLDTRFVAVLLEKPAGALFDANRNELLYLISRNDDEAVGAGVAVLVELLRNPETFIEGDRTYQRYGKEELAFALSRTEAMPRVLCRLPAADRERVVAFYQHNTVLWRNTDPPWQPGNLPCKD